MARTQEEIQTLKEQWKCDPCWDIETTEGFEAHKDELLAYRLQQEKKWEVIHAAEVQREVKRYAELHGFGDNLKLAAHIRDLEIRLQGLEG